MRSNPIFLGICILGITIFHSCRPRVTFPHVAVFSTVETLMRDDSTRTGCFTNTSLFDAKYEQIEYRTSLGTLFVKNDGTQNVLICRYDTATFQPIWIAVGGGKGGDGGCNYYTVPPENAVYVVGYFDDTAFFPIKAGETPSDTLISRGGADMFVAKYSYDKGTLEWCVSGGSQYSDIVFTDNLGARHQETFMVVDSVMVTVYTNFFGPSRFGDQSIDAPLTGSAVQISFDKETGIARDARIPDSLPSCGGNTKVVNPK